MSDLIYTEAQRATIAASRSEAFELLQEIQAANENLKDIVEAVAESTGIKKAKIMKYYKQKFDDKLKALSEDVALFEFLDEE